MSKRTIVALPGDGIGKAVPDETIRVLDAAGFEAEYVEGDIGWEFWCKEGNPLPERTIDLIEKHKIGLFGAITSKPKDEAFEELAPELKEKGLWIYCAQVDTENLISTTDFSGPAAIVIGSEGYGVSRLVKENCDYMVKIPMSGHVNSLNASVSAALVIYEIYNKKG